MKNSLFRHSPEEILLLALRVGLGLLFLWAFFDKLFGLGFATAAEDAWLAGGSPTTGYLLYATQGPFAGMFRMLAGQVWVDVLFMVGLFGIGTCLTLGRWMRLATSSGILLMLLMYLSAFPPEHHPFLDEHVMYALVLGYLGYKSRS